MISNAAAKEYIIDFSNSGTTHMTSQCPTTYSFNDGTYDYTFFTSIYTGTAYYNITQGVGLTLKRGTSAAELMAFLNLDDVLSDDVVVTKAETFVIDDTAATDKTYVPNANASLYTTTTSFNLGGWTTINGTAFRYGTRNTLQTSGCAGGGDPTSFMYFDTGSNAEHFIIKELKLTTNEPETADTNSSIYFDEDNYYIGEYHNITATLANGDWGNYTYFFELTDPDGNFVERGQIFSDAVFPATVKSDTVFTDIGLYTVTMYSCGYGNCVFNRQNITDDTAFISNEGSSQTYLVFNKTSYALGEQMSLTYNIGDFNNSKYDYSIEFYDTAGNLLNTQHLSNSNGDYLPIHSKLITGTYSAWLRSIVWGGVQKNTLDTAQVFYGGGGSNETLSGNVTIDGSLYNRTEIVPIKYNLSLNGRLQINNPINSYFYSITSGNDQTFNYYLPEDAPIGSYTVYLQYYDGLTYNIMDYDTFSVSSTGQNYIEFTNPRKIYLQGETITINAIGLDNGYIKLLDTNNTIKLNATITANTLTSYEYYVSNTDLTGPWVVNLYNSTGVIVSTDNADIYTSGYGQVVPTYPAVTSGSGSSGSGTIDYVGNKTARKEAENSFFNTFYSGMNGLFSLAILSTLVMFLKMMGKW